jgi:hypothetical protein
MSVSGDSDDEDLSLESLTQHLSRHTEQRPLSTNSMGGAVCCCGSDQCESLRKNQNIFQELESQMKIAGSLGQVSARRLPRFCVSFSHGVCVGCFSGELVLLASVMSGFFPCFFLPLCWVVAFVMQHHVHLRRTHIHIHPLTFGC